MLPAELASDPDRRERFEREAKAIAALNHPNICTLYDVGHEDGTDFLVLEHLEGESLQDRLTKGALPLDQALQIAIQIADALDKAHRQGITHRDLKPGNIFLAKKSGAKLLDFGLAKLTGPLRSATASAERSTKLADSLTAQGTILGTFHYMAPEQLEGHEADSRSDIWAFGCVVYEMVTGKKAFEGKSQASLISAIMKDEPPPTSANQSTFPPLLDHIVATCLSRDRERRWHSVGDVGRQLAWLDPRASAAVVPIGVSSGRSPGSLLLAATAGAVVGALLLGSTFYFAGSTTTGVSRYPVTTTGRLVRGAGPLLDVSDSGRTLVYLAATSSGEQLYRRSFDELQAVPIPGTEGAWLPAVSPEERWVAFAVEGELKKVALDGGAPITLCVCGVQASVTWGSNDVIYFSSRVSPGAGLVSVPAAGGVPEPVTTLEGNETLHRGADVLPGAGGILFTAFSGTGDMQVVVQSLVTGERRVTLEGRYPRYAASGHLLFVRENTMWAVPLDLNRLDLIGDPVPVVQDVRQERNGAAQFTVSKTGTLIYIPAEEGATQETLAWARRGGDVTTIDVGSDVLGDVRISPNGEQVALTLDSEGARNLWVLDVERNALTRETLTSTTKSSPVWMPDGNRIIFGLGPGENSNLFWKSLGPGTESESLLESPAADFPSSVSPDGALLAFDHAPLRSKEDIWLLSLEDRSASPFWGTDARLMEPMFAPSGEWIAYQSNASGQWEVLLAPYPGPGRHVPVSVGGGRAPRWSAAGDELFYVSPDRALMAVTVETAPTVHLGEPQEVLPITSLVAYDVHPDAERFVIIRESEDQQTTGQLNVVEHWFTELERLVPTN